MDPPGGGGIKKTNDDLLNRVNFRLAGLLPEFRKGLGERTFGVQVGLGRNDRLRRDNRRVGFLGRERLLSQLRYVHLCGRFLPLPSAVGHLDLVSQGGVR